MMEQVIYGGTVVIRLDSRHRYTVSVDGAKPVKALSVTQHLDLLDKPALVQWAANQCKDYLLGLEPWNFVAMEAWWRAAADTMRSEFRKTAKSGADIGTIVHAWVRDYAQGIVQHMPEDEKAAAAVDKFLTWARQHDLELWDKAERMVYHPELGYVGTMDLPLKLDGVRRVFDLKTNNTSKATPTGIYPEHHYQTAAYAMARDYERVYAGDDDPAPTLTGIIRCGKDGTFDWELRDVVQVTKDANVFTKLVELKKAMT